MEKSKKSINQLFKKSIGLVVILCMGVISVIVQFFGSFQAYLARFLVNFFLIQAFFTRFKVHFLGFSFQVLNCTFMSQEIDHFFLLFLLNQFLTHTFKVTLWKDSSIIIKTLLKLFSSKILAIFNSKQRWKKQITICKSALFL